MKPSWNVWRPRKHGPSIPIVSMYGIYANIWGILMVSVTIYTWIRWDWLLVSEFYHVDMIWRGPTNGTMGNHVETWRYREEKNNLDVGSEKRDVKTIPMWIPWESMALPRVLHEVGCQTSTGPVVLCPMVQSTSGRRTETMRAAAACLVLKRSGRGRNWSTPCAKVHRFPRVHFPSSALDARGYPAYPIGPKDLRYLCCFPQSNSFTAAFTP